MRRFKGNRYIIVTIIIICIVSSMLSISAFAKKGRKDKGSRNYKYGQSRWYGRWKNDEDESEKDATSADKDESNDLEEIPSDNTTDNNEVVTDNTVTNDNNISQEDVDNIANDNNIGYMKKVDSSSVDSSAKICSSVSDFKNAISSAKAGSVIYMKGGTYSGASISIAAQGSSTSYITIKNYPGEVVIFTNSTVTFESSAKYINFEGFILKDYTPSDDWGNCVRFKGGSSYINFRNNELSNITCRGTGEVGVNAIVLYGDSSSSINNVTIENCYVYNCKTGWSEAITTDGNVENCLIKNCTVDNTGNIGIDLCGNFSWTGTVGSTTNQSRNITVTRNKVMNCNSSYATSAGLYCDGGRDNTFSYNIVYNSQCGIELGAEEKGADVANFEVHNNIIVNCGRAIGAGAYLSTGAKHYNTNVYDNTIICNEANPEGENCAIYLERTTGFTFKNNVVYAKTSKTEFVETSGSASYTLQGNTWYVEGGNGSKPSADATGVFKNPNIANLDAMLNGQF